MYAVYVSKQSYFKQFSLSTVYRLVLFNLLIVSYQMLPPRVRVDMKAMAAKGYSEFPKDPELLEPHHQIVKCHVQGTCRGVFPLCRETVGVYFSLSDLER